MVHYVIGVILSRVEVETYAYLEEYDPQEEVDLLLAPYKANLEVPPYQRRLSWQDIDGITALYKCNPLDLSTCVPYIRYWTGMPGGLDGEGLYTWTTRNPRARWDWYDFIDGYGEEDPDEVPCDCDDSSPVTETEWGKQLSYLPELAEPKINMQEVPDMGLVRDLSPEPGCFAAIVTPRGQWLDVQTSSTAPSIFGHKTSGIPALSWLSLYADILATYPDHQIVAFQCKLDVPTASCKSPDAD